MTNTTSNFRIENIAPILYVEDMKRSLQFYVDILGFENAAWGDENFTSVNRENSGLYLCKGGQGMPGTWVWIGFDGDISLFHQKLLAKGVKIKLPPTNFSWAYEMQVEDPDGHILRFGTDPDQNSPFHDSPT
ncbi:glyoxalase superfamily protein [Chryseosolibacter indicus]|uniref:VOC family protein n=1 Tax=Chryseosolibacter indicus TaxID=2782351 RepID=A0ABS5VYA2_9BACT|nr:glyoxalase superfamily protein [Chryseosolibacter indicus]MBT1706383.1 VOC family protein [Chryseosolibacter indicus]